MRSNKSSLPILTVMLELHYGTASEKVIVTLNELVTLTTPNYLFVFVHVTTKNTVAFVRLNSDDESAHPSRYNQFSIATVTTFLNQPPGEWHYEVYEQASAVNTDPDLATLIESGKMILYPATAFEQTKYDETTTFRAYNG